MKYQRLVPALFIGIAALGGVQAVRAGIGRIKEYKTPVLLANLQDKRVRESSGLAASRRMPGVYWTHNDSGGKAEIFALDRKGSPIGLYAVPNAENVDWEDIAAGPGQNDRPCLYIGDIGDNKSNRTDTVIYRITEPPLDPSKTLQTGKSTDAEKLPYVYPDGSHNSETLLVHPKTGEIFLVTKENSGVSGVYRFPMPLTPGRQATLEKVATVRFTNPLALRGQALGKLATGGCIAPDGSRLALRTYTDGFEWNIKPGQSVGDALKAAPRPFAVPWIGQFESLCYSLDGQALLTTSEGVPCPLWEIPKK